MRRFALLLIVILAAGGAWYGFYGAKNTALTRAQAYLTAMGFTQTTIGGADIAAHRTDFSAITLEQTGLDKIDSLSVSRGWMDIFSGDDQINLTITSPDLYRTYDHINDLLPGVTLLAQDNLASLPDGHIAVQNGRLNISTPLGLFQFLFNIVIDSYQGDKRLVSATIKSAQDTFDFTSEWRGWIMRDGTFLIDGLLPEIRAQVGPVRLSRGNGWLSLAGNGAWPALSGQIESGAASLGTLPLQSFTLTLDARQDDFTILTRARASGAQETLIAGDIVLNPAQQQIAFTLDSRNLPGFFSYLDENVKRPATALRQSFKDIDALSVIVDYQLTKRFPGGPYPFDMRGVADDKEFLSGTFLIYPGTFDMRGSAKIAGPYLPGVRDYFRMGDEAISGDYIRLDTSLAPLLSGIGAGIKNDLGERP